MTRAVQAQLLEVREQVEAYDEAIDAAAPSHAGEGGFDPFTLLGATSGPALGVLRNEALEVVRDLDPNTAVTTAVAMLTQVRTLLDAATPDNGLAAAAPTDPPLLSYVHARLRDAANAADRVLDDLQTLVSTIATPLGLQDVGESVSAISAYPLLTGDAASTSTADPRSAGNLQLVVDATVRDVIGRLPRYTDARAFEDALASSFGITDSNGIRTVTWRPRSYGGSGGLGPSVTGIQASVYARALGARDAVVPLLLGLRPLLPDFDPQEVDAARSIVRAELDALVEELGTEGGPRRARVDQLFDVLFTQTTTGPKGSVGGGMVGYLGYTFGFADDEGRPTNVQVNTVDEEQDLSNYVLLVDHLKTVQQSWQAFVARTGRDLGTQLFQLSRVLQVVAESVDEIESALDSVFVGDAERAVIRFDTTSGDEMLVDEFLSWVRSFAATEAPALVAGSGRRGLGPIADTASRLRAINDDLVSEIANDADLPDGLRHPRVRYPLQELRGYLGQVALLSERANI